MKSNLEILLGEWGSWKRGDNFSSLGAPTGAAFTSMHVDGQRRSDPYAFLVDDDMRRIDRIIEAAHPDIRGVLVAHYVWAGPLKGKLDRIHIDRRRFYTHLEFAHQHVGHALGGQYALAPKLSECFEEV